MERFDAAVIGAGPEGLVAATVLARSGLKVAVLEKNAEAGGRAATLEFHPGFWASAYADELPLISPRLFRALDLGRAGALLAPASASLCVSDDGETVLFADAARAARFVAPEDRDALAQLRRELAETAADIDRRAAFVDAPHGSLRAFGRAMPNEPWPGESWMPPSLDQSLRMRFAGAGLRLHLAADALSGRAASPFLAGSALHLLAPGAGRSGVPLGGLGGLGSALERSARDAGVELRFDSPVQEIKLRRGRVAAAVLASGEELRARRIVSALDLKRTLALVPWNALGEDEGRRVAAFRMRGARARVLFALDAPPEFPFAREKPDFALGAVHVAPSFDGFALAHESWRGGAIPEAPLVTLRVPSFADPRLAPVGKAVMTATLGTIPAHLMDGPWDDEKRHRLVTAALIAADRATPGIARRVIATRTIAASDIEERLGLSDGDFEGGELAPDQALGQRPFAEWRAGRTPVPGLYLAGPSAAPSPFLTGASGERAALALLADRRAARLP